MPYFSCPSFAHLFHKTLHGKANSVDPGQTDSEGAILSGFANAIYQTSWCTKY